MTRPAEPLSVYVHVPFCARRCPYCTFTALAGADHLHEAYLSALRSEIALRSVAVDGRPVDTVFVGGGTPTRLGAGRLAEIIGAIGSAFALSPECEITVEANPETVDESVAAALMEAGVTRLSLGAQTLDDHELARIGRGHDAEAVGRAVTAARAAGAAEVSLDLMFGLPGQSVASWERTLCAAGALAPDHVSAYELALEEGTAMSAEASAGRLDLPDADAVADMYELTIDRLAKLGFLHYEVSNFSRHAGSGRGRPGRGRPGRGRPESGRHGREPDTAHACRHNLNYWRNGEYVGLGPGAHGHLRGDGDVAFEVEVGTGRCTERGTESGANVEAMGDAEVRYANVADIESYVSRLDAGLLPTAWTESVDRRTAMAETMMLGLRLVGEGVPLRRFEALHGLGVGDVYAVELAELVADGLLEIDRVRCRLTHHGLMLGNQVFARFMP